MQLKVPIVFVLVRLVVHLIPWSPGAVPDKKQQYPVKQFESESCWLVRSSDVVSLVPVMWVCVIKHDFIGRAHKSGGWAPRKKRICILKTYYKALTIRQDESATSANSGGGHMTRDKKGTTHLRRCCRLEDMVDGLRTGRWQLDVTCTAKMHFIVHCCLVRLGRVVR